MGNGNCMVQDIENIKFKDSHILPPIILPCDLKKEKKKTQRKTCTLPIQMANARMC